MPGKNRIVLNGWGRIGRAQVNAVLSSGADCLGLREVTDVPPIEVKKCCEPPVVLIAKDQCDVLGPVRIKNLEQKYGICIVSAAMQLPFPKDELLEMKDELKKVVALKDKPVPPLPDICSSSKRRGHQQEARGMAKKKKAKRRRQKDARRNNRR